MEDMFFKPSIYYVVGIRLGTFQAFPMASKAHPVRWVACVLWLRRTHSSLLETVEEHLSQTVRQLFSPGSGLGPQ